jgi:hypothetical protein
MPTSRIQTWSGFLREAAEYARFAVERGLDTIAVPCSSDVDIITTKRDFLRILDVAVRDHALLHVAMAYGGARVFLKDEHENVKRFDFTWTIHWYGIHFVTGESLLSLAQTDPATGLPVLPPHVHARILYFVKNAYGGAERYRSFLAQQGFAELDRAARRRYLAAVLLRAPVLSALGFIRTILCYLLRVRWPTGLIVTGAAVEVLRGSKRLNYLFSGRIDARAGVGAAFRARVGSRMLVAPPGKKHDLDVAGCPGDEVDTCIIQFLASRSGLVPALFRVLC